MSGAEQKIKKLKIENHENNLNLLIEMKIDLNKKKVSIINYGLVFDSEEIGDI